MAEHDKAFRALLEEEGVIEALLRERLPARVVRCFAGSMLRLSEAFVDDGLKASFAEVVRVQLKGGGEAFVYCIIEHKRRADGHIALQLLRYMDRLYAYLAKRARGQRLPPVIALVVYNGRTPWKWSRRFSDVIESDGALRSMVLDFEFAVLDIGAVADAQLSRHDVLRAGLLALKTATVAEADQPAKVIKILHLMRGQSTAKPFLVYLQWVIGAERLASLQEAVRRASPEDEKTMISIAESLINKGREAGHKEGHEEGVRRGLAIALTQMLVHRFTRVPAKYTKRINAANPDVLSRWLAIAQDAASLDAVFRRH